MTALLLLLVARNPGGALLRLVLGLIVICVIAMMISFGETDEMHYKFEQENRARAAMMERYKAYKLLHGE